MCVEASYFVNYDMIYQRASAMRPRGHTTGTIPAPAPRSGSDSGRRAIAAHTTLSLC